MRDLLSKNNLRDILISTTLNTSLVILQRHEMGPTSLWTDLRFLLGKSSLIQVCYLLDIKAQFIILAQYLLPSSFY